MKLNPAERKTLKYLAAWYSEDYGIMSFRPIQRKTRLSRAAVRRACRSLARKGLTKFTSGCWTEDGDPAGSGYGATEAGYHAALEMFGKEQIERARPWWDY